MISAVIFDLDGTLTKVPSPWRYVHERLGVWETTACAYLDEWLTGRITYEEFCRRDTRLWNGRSVSEIESLLDEIDWNRHVSFIARRLMDAKVPSIIISSGFHYVARKIQTHCDWRGLTIFANELVEGPEVQIKVSGDFSSPISKKAVADAALQSVGSMPRETLVVSDTVRDLEQLCHCQHRLLIRHEDDLLRVNDYLD
jgi:phosphoserine phosphatase